MCGNTRSAATRRAAASTACMASRNSGPTGRAGCGAKEDTMALTNTTLAAAMGANDMQLKVTSATGFAVGQLVRVDNEEMVQTAAASGVYIPVRRGLDGSA